VKIRYPSIRRQAFTLIELLIVVTVVAILGSLLFTSLQRMGAASKSAGCQANLRKVGLGMLQYAADHAGWLPPHHGNTYEDRSKETAMIWYGHIAPYITSWDGENLSTAPIDKVFRCPADPTPYNAHSTYESTGDSSKWEYTYGFNFTRLGSRYDPSSFADPAVTLGSSTSLRRLSYPGRLVIVTDIPHSTPTGFSTDDAVPFPETNDGFSGFYPYTTNGRVISNRHDKGANFLFADGHVEYRKLSDILDANFNIRNWNPLYDAWQLD